VFPGIVLARAPVMTYPVRFTVKLSIEHHKMPHVLNDHLNATALTFKVRLRAEDGCSAAGATPETISTEGVLHSLRLLLGAGFAM
jgi:hypothetical protein